MSAPPSPSPVPTSSAPNALLLSLDSPPSGQPGAVSSPPSPFLQPTPSRFPVRRNPFSILNPVTTAGDVFLSPPTTASRSTATSPTPRQKRPAPMNLEIPSFSTPPAYVSPTSGGPLPLPSPLFKDIEKKHGNTPRGESHQDAVTFPFPMENEEHAPTTDGHAQEESEHQMSVDIPAAPITPTTTRVSKQEYTAQQLAHSHTQQQQHFLSVPGALTPPFTPPHGGQASLPPSPKHRPQPILVPAPNDPFLPPTPTSPAICIPLPPSPTCPPSLGPSSDQLASLFTPGHELSPAFLRYYALHESPQLGSGGFGFVLLAKQQYAPYADVAVKFIVKTKVPSHGWARDPILGVVPIEVVVLRIVDHECIVRFVDFFEDGVYYYLVQELHGTPWTPQPTLLPLPPTPTTPVAPLSPAQLAPPTRPAPVRRASYDLFECIERHTRLSEPQARYIFAQVVSAVTYLHARGITHRDIKDENILIDDKFRVKLIDFGSCAIADVRRPPPLHTRFFGTMNFASPEILRNESYRAPEAEIWTLGILLHILVTGECPFSSNQAAMEGRINPPRRGVAMSRSCDSLVKGCLEVDCRKRLTIDDIGRHAWLTGASQ